MSKICKDPSDIFLQRKVFTGKCGCDCENQGSDFTPVGQMCKKCGHIQRRLRA